MRKAAEIASGTDALFLYDGYADKRRCQNCQKIFSFRCCAILLALECRERGRTGGEGKPETNEPGGTQLKHWSGRGRLETSFGKPTRWVRDRLDGGEGRGSGANERDWMLRLRPESRLSTKRGGGEVVGRWQKLPRRATVRVFECIPQGKGRYYIIHIQTGSLAHDPGTPGVSGRRGPGR